MIVTVTPNPSLDLLYEAGRLLWDDANRIAEPRRRPGGQGINVARTAHVLGADVTALALLGGATGYELRVILQEEGTPLRAVPAALPTRLFVAVREREARRALLLNSPGPDRTAAEADQLLRALAELLRERPRRWVAACGSLPPGFPADFYARAGAAARAAGARFVPDCDGDALRLAAAAGCDLLVPNQHEATRLLGHVAGDDATSAAAAAVELLALPCPMAAITLGARGAVLATRAGVWHASGPAQEGSAVGAGDAFLAGLLIALEMGVGEAEALRRATACGSAALVAPGSAMLTPAAFQEALAVTQVTRI